MEACRQQQHHSYSVRALQQSVQHDPNRSAFDNQRNYYMTVVENKKQPLHWQAPPNRFQRNDNENGLLNIPACVQEFERCEHVSSMMDGIRLSSQTKNDASTLGARDDPLNNRAVEPARVVDDCCRAPLPLPLLTYVQSVVSQQQRYKHLLLRHRTHSHAPYGTDGHHHHDARRPPDPVQAASLPSFLWGKVVAIETATSNDEQQQEQQQKYHNSNHTSVISSTPLVGSETTPTHPACCLATSNNVPFHSSNTTNDPFALSSLFPVQCGYGKVDVSPPVTGLSESFVPRRPECTVSTGRDNDYSGLNVLESWSDDEDEETSGDDLSELTAPSTITSQSSAPKQQQQKVATQKSVKKQAAEICRLVKRGDKVAIQAAERILCQVVGRSENNQQGSRLDGACFRLVSKASLALGRSKQACTVVLQMYKDFANDNQKAKPDGKWLNEFVFSYMSAELAPQFLDAALFRIYHLYNRTPALHQWRPTTRNFTHAMRCWLTLEDKPVAAQRISSIFDFMKVEYTRGENKSIRPDLRSYSVVIQAFANSNDWIEAETAFWKMVHGYRDGVEKEHPHTHEANTIMVMYSKSAAHDAPNRAREFINRIFTLAEDLCPPDKWTYGLLLKSWCTSKRSDALQQSLACFQWISQQCNDGGDELVSLDEAHYSTIVCIMLQHGESGRAVAFLQKMCRELPEISNTQCDLFRRVARQCVIERRPDQAHSILRLMWKLVKSGHGQFRPNQTLYETICVGLVELAKFQTAQSLLAEMESKRVGTCNKTLRARVRKALKHCKCSSQRETFAERSALRAFLKARDTWDHDR